jgi:hypothetical protein
MCFGSIFGSETLENGFREGLSKTIIFWHPIFTIFIDFWYPGASPNRVISWGRVIMRRLFEDLFFAFVSSKPAEGLLDAKSRPK